MIGQAKRIIELSNLGSEMHEDFPDKIISFTSGKGGTGKTVVAVNLAYRLSQLKNKVLLVDLDSNFSNINILMNIYSENTLHNFLSGKELFTDLIYRHEKNFHIIFGESGNTEFENPRKDIVQFIFTQLRKIQGKYDYIIIDSSAGLNEEVVSILTNSDLNIIVTSPEPTSIMDAYVILKFMKRKNITVPKKVLLNKCTDDKDTELAFANLNEASNHFLKEPVSLLGSVPFDKNVNRSIVEQELLMKNAPGTDAAIKISEVALQIVEYIQVVNSSQTPGATLSK